MGAVPYRCGGKVHYRIPFMESKEFFRIAVKRGAAMVQIAVTSPVVIRTTNTQPGTSPRSSLNRAKNELCFLINELRN